LTNLIDEFPTITRAANIFGINDRTIHIILNRYIFYKDFVFKSIIEDNRVKSKYNPYFYYC